MKAAKARRAALFLLLLLGVSVSIRLSVLHFAGAAACPMLGPLPACVLVAAIYLTMFLVRPVHGAANARKRLVFSIALALGGGLALLGSALELMGQDVCPHGPLGVPMCDLSLVMCLSIGWLAA